MSSLLITGARVLGADQPSDILITKGAVTAIEKSQGAGKPSAIDAPAKVTTLDAEGQVLLPGLVDVHTHLREPGREDAETITSGSAAAAVGGFAAVLAMANTNPVTDTAQAALAITAMGQACGLVDVIPVGAVTKGLEGAELAELGLMNRQAGVTLFSDDGKCVADDRLMRRALEYIRAFGGVISQHSQNPELAGPSSCCHEGELSGRLGLPGWPTAAETTIIARDADLAKLTGSRVHVAHVTTAEGVEVVRWAKKRGISMTAEVTPHHLLLTTDLLTDYDPVYKVNPPLRPVEDTLALREALIDGTIDVVATDHAPHARHDKEHAFEAAAFGMLGLESALSVISELFVTTGRLTWEQVAQVMSIAPARLAGLSQHGRPIEVGQPGTLTLVDPESSVTIDRDASLSLSRNNPWHGRTFTGAPTATILRGRLTAHNGKITA